MRSSGSSRGIGDQGMDRRKVLRRSAGAGLSLLGLGAVAGSGAAQESEQPNSDVEGSIRVMVWSGLVEEIVREYAVPPFQAKYPNVTVELEIGTNADLYPKLLATRDSPQYAGAMMNGLFSARGNLDGMWGQLDPAIMTNAASIPEELNPPGGNGYALMLTQCGIAYNPEMVTEPPTSWTDLYKPEYEGRVIMSDGYFAAYQMAALLEGHSIDDVEAGIRIWEGYKDNIGAWSNSEGQKAELLTRGDMWLAPKFGAWTEQEIAQGKTEVFVTPEEGAIQWSGALQVVRGISDSDAELVQLFFNEWYSREFQEQFVLRGSYIPARPDVEVPAELRETSAAVMTADEAREQLLRYDLEAVAERQREYTAMIQRTLRS